MGKRGTKPKPTALKKLQGNPGKRPLNKHEPKPKTAKRPRRPAWLSDEAKKCWDRIAPPLYDCGILTDLDVLALALLCEDWAMYKDALDLYVVEGIVTTSEKGNLYQHPAVGAMNKAEAKLHKWLAEFGMTPSSRSQLKITEEPKEKSLAEELLGPVNAALAGKDK